MQNLIVMLNREVVSDNVSIPAWRKRHAFTHDYSLFYVQVNGNSDLYMLVRGEAVEIVNRKTS